MILRVDGEDWSRGTGASMFHAENNGVPVGTATSGAYAFYWEAFASVWCFFAAAASVVILCHFEWSRRQRLRMAGA